MSVTVCKSNILFIIILTLKTRRNFLQRTRNRKKMCIYIVVCHRNRHSSNSSAWTKHDIVPNSHDCATCRYCYIRRETVRLASTWESFNLSLYYIYHPQTKFANFMSVCLSTGGWWYPSMPCRWYPSMPCRSPGGWVSQHALQVSRPTPRGKVEGSGRGVSRPTPSGVSRPSPVGFSRPTSAGVYPSMH